MTKPHNHAGANPAIASQPQSKPLVGGGAEFGACCYFALLISKFINRSLLLCFAGVLLLSGCMTSLTVQAISAPKTEPLHDYIDRIERASVTENNDLVILVEARLSNSTHSDRYTMVVPLTQIAVGHYLVLYGHTATNDPPMGWCRLDRSRIVPGWEARESAGLRPVSIGPPVLYEADEWVRECKVRPDAERMLFRVVETGTNWQEEVTTPSKFIYVDGARPEVFAMIGVEASCVTQSTKGLYWVLPFSVVGDIATLPIQLPVFLFTFHDAYGH